LNILLATFSDISYKEVCEGDFFSRRNPMIVIGQWILFGIVVLLGLILLWHAAKYIFKLAFVIAVTVLIVYGLHRYELLPIPAQKYIDELVSGDTVRKAKDWFQQWIGDEIEKKSPQDEENASS
jgi:hypothetical protein